MASITLQLVPDFVSTLHSNALSQRCHLTRRPLLLPYQNVQQRMYKGLPMEAFIDGFREMVSSVDSFSAGPNFYTGTVNHLLRKTRTVALRARLRG